MRLYPVLTVLTIITSTLAFRQCIAEQPIQQPDHKYLEAAAQNSGAQLLASLNYTSAQLAAAQDQIAALSAKLASLQEENDKLKAGQPKPDPLTKECPAGQICSGTNQK